MKCITIAGNIGKDAVTRLTQNGDKVTGWTVAVEERNGQEKRSIWFDVSIWGKRGESLCQYLTKGSKVSVSGELSTREHEGKTYLTIRADQVTLMGGKREDRDEDPHGGYSKPLAAPPRNDLDDDLPF